MKYQEYIVTESIEPTRLDRYLRHLFPSLTQGVLQKFLRSGYVKRDGKKLDASDRINQNDLLQLEIVFNKYKSETERIEDNPSNEMLAKKILGEYKIYEDENFIAINKPSGIASQGGSNITNSIDAALQYLNNKNSPNDFENGYRIVHRLDKETSGVFLIAKNRKAAMLLTNAFKEKFINKTYLALVVGDIKQKTGTIKTHISKNVKLRRQQVSRQGEYAETDFEIIKSLGTKHLVKYEPKTGRMHQIRVHTTHIGAVIVGDLKYGYLGPKSRLMLHAESVVIQKEVFDRKIIIFSDLPKEFNF